ncbi:hypothetical protein BASA60_002664 [Batrachochytrium salamandrivorans]|nr:hypothetical protein BASA60_002664 [Batrachochytrium salamandrivorans]
MSIPTLVASHVFGVNHDVRNNICYLDEMTVVYPAGHQIVIYNIEQKSQRFIPVHFDGEVISTLEVCTAQSVIAVGTKAILATKSTTTSEKTSVVALYDLHSGRRQKIFTTSEAPANKGFISVEFTSDFRHVIALGMGPDWCIYMWSIDKTKLIAWTRAASNSNACVNQMSCHTHDPKHIQVCVTGNCLFRIFRIVDGGFKLSHQTKIDKNLLCHAWVNDSRIIAGTQDSKILVFDTGNFVLEIAYTMPQPISNDAFSSQPWQYASIPAVNTITVLSTGIFTGLSTGTGVLFEKTDDSDLYRKSKEFLFDEAEICCVSFDPQEETAFVAMKNSQIYTVSLESDIKGEEIKSDWLLQSSHSGRITAMDVSISKPLLVTCGIDKSVRVWNYIEKSIEVVKYFDEAAQCVAIHPNGLYLLMGFSNSIKLMAMLIDDINPFWDSSIQGCKECRFSNGGQCFAVAWGTSVYIYNTWSFEIVKNLKSSGAKIQSIAWSNDDNTILAWTVEGTISQWNLATLSKECEVSTKDASVTSVVMTHTSKTIYSVMNSGNIQEITNGAISRELSSKTTLSELLISRSGQMMFAATMRGNIRAIKFPFGQDSTLSGPDTFDYAFHSQPITHLRISFDDQYLFSCGEDGCVWIFRIDYKDGVLSKQEKDWSYGDEILVTKSDQRENHRTMNELKKKVEQLKAENDIRLKHKDESYSLKIKEATQKYTAEVEILREAVNLLRLQRTESEKRRKSELSETKRNHQREILEMKDAIEVKMRSEGEKYIESTVKIEELKKKWELQIQDIELVHKKQVGEITEFYSNNIQEKQDLIQLSKKEFEHHTQKFETLVNDVEADVDREALEISFGFETRLKDERESLTVIREENISMKSKFDHLTRQIEEQKRELFKGGIEEKKLHTIIKSYENDVVDAKKEIQERDDTILDKEKHIYDLKKKNQELEKFKFVLDYKIVELRKQVEPREKDIVQLFAQINAMSEEVKIYNQNNRKCETEYQDLVMKHHAVRRDKSVEGWRNALVQGTLERFRKDLAQVYNHLPYINDAKAKLVEIYHKYRDISTDAINNPPTDLFYKRSGSDLFQSIDILQYSSTKKEFHKPSETEIDTGRTREHLEKKAAVMRVQLAKNKEKRIEYTHKMHLENTALSSEVNSLRVSIQNRKERLYSLTQAQNQGKTLKQFIKQELETMSIRKLTDPVLYGNLLEKPTLPLTPVLPSITPNNK